MYDVFFFLILFCTNLSCSDGLEKKSHLKNLFKPKCKFDEDIIKSDKLLHYVHSANFVFTGRVISAAKVVNNSLAFDVLVQRSFKNTEGLKNDQKVKVSKLLHEGEGVKCRQVVRARFTAIFIGQIPQEHTADVELLISPVPVTLTNLDRVSGATRDTAVSNLSKIQIRPDKESDVVHEPRPQVVEDFHKSVPEIFEPCENTFCAWGAYCVTGPDGRALCECPRECRKDVAPVCGSDGVTYENHCELRVASCRARLNTQVEHVGKCEQIDPCREKQCINGARCIVHANARNTSCVCPDKCPSYNDRTSRPVCGSDGVNYSNECKLQKAACTTNTNITVKFTGKCDPCAGWNCTEPEICQLDDHRNPVCRCSDTCPLEFNPVCGSDGKTYSNECSMRQEACRRKKTLHIIYRGKCSSGINPCMSVQCGFGEECTINKFGIAHCECLPSCDPVMRPVCTKDARTFSSECEMLREACMARTPIDFLHRGVCGEKGPCSDHMCQYGSTCVEKSGTPYCECPICPAEFAPVCGSDGISYGNECKLRLEACKHRRDIRVLYDSPCNGCENKKCDFYSICEGDGFTEGKCVCPKTCNDSSLINDAVCGTNGITYSSECELRTSSCKHQQYVVVAYKGNCDLCENVKCKYGARCQAGNCVCPTNCEGSGVEPVCASNMMTFPNECELQKAMCLQAPNSSPLTVVFYGDCRERFPLEGATNSTFPSVTPVQTTDPGRVVTDFATAQKEACKDIHCDFEATCELGAENFPRCTCQFNCSTELHSTSKPVCASDLRIYPSLCAMKMEACQRQEELRLRPLELCQGMEVKPCRGEQPMTDPISGKELDCGSGPQRKDCPSDSYCHQTTKVSRCCKKGQNEVDEMNCEGSWYGCCPNSQLPAQGPNFAGCPSSCGCNRLGAISGSCDPETKQCRCRPGVGGEKCDRCEPGYWGLPKISSGHQGCIPCACSTFGSVRDDCEQMTGRCVCKPGVQGQKCTVCTSHERVLGPNGCVRASLIHAVPTSCKDHSCYFGATCLQRGGRAYCECNVNCEGEEDKDQIVCGSDGQTYSNICHLNKLACHLQKDIVLQAFGSCKDNVLTSTDGPVHHYTPLQFTQPDESNSLSKSTRHLLAPDPRYFYERTGSQTGSDQGVSYPVEENRIITSKIKPPNGKINSLFDINGGNFDPAYRPTPATVHVIAALLGDICSENSDCLIVNSHCLNEACVCSPDFVESIDRQECLAESNSNSVDEFQACASFPCMNGATCINLPGATFACLCTLNNTGNLCEIEINLNYYNVPAFVGNSYIKLKPLKAYFKLSIEIEFRSYTYNGILMYNQQKMDGSGDYVSLAIINGFVEFKYNLGNGPAVIRSVNKIELMKYHKLTVKRYHKDGILKLDENEDVGGQSPGSLKALDLLEDTFLGFIPANNSQVFDNIGTSYGFQGCIRKLKIGRHNMQMYVNKDEKVIKAEHIYDCNDRPCSAKPCLNDGFCIEEETNLYQCKCNSQYTGKYCEKFVNPCLSNPCLHGSTCIEVNTDEFFCKCVSHRTGRLCEIDSREHVTPEFDGSSFIKYPLNENLKHSFSIEVHFMPKSLNGIIVYSGQNKIGHGDFISLHLTKGHVQFRFNLGSGVANITSKEMVSVGKWQKVKISRKGREGVLQLDNSSTIYGYSGMPMSQLDLDLPLYIGSVWSWKRVHRLSGASKGFKGAIQKLFLNDKPLPINMKLEDCYSFNSNKSICSVNVLAYNGPPCPKAKNPCHNSGTCIPMLNEFKCKCHAHYRGKYCQISQRKNYLLSFDGATFLQYRGGSYKRRKLFRVKPERWNRYEIKLRTSAANGLILWRCKNKNFLQNYISLAVVNGYIELSYNLGSPDLFFSIRSNVKINDGEWHTVRIQRRKRVGFITVDNNLPTKGISKDSGIILHTNAKLWIGGTTALPPGLPTSYYSGFVGCIQYVLINGKPLDMLANNGHSKHRFCQENTT